MAQPNITNYQVALEFSDSMGRGDMKNERLLGNIPNSY